MKRNQVAVLLLAIFLSLGIVATLYVISPLSKEIYRASFDRKINDRYLAKLGPVMDIEFNSFYIAGYSDTILYLGNSTAPFHLLKTNLSLTDSSHIRLQVKLDSVRDVKLFRLSVIPPNFYLAHGTQPIILKGDILNSEAYPLITDEGCYFTDAIAVASETFVLKSYSNASKGYALARKTRDSFAFNYDLLQKQIDGLFCVDGKLLYNQKLNKFIYLYFYRNQFIVTDADLNLNYRGNTIDTFSHARIKVAQIGNETESMLTGLPTIINGLSCTDGDFLYVQSNLLAKNEDMAQFKSGSTIDCYLLADGKYVGSFHIPNYNGEHLTSFQVVSDKLFAVFGRHLIRFSLNLNPP